MSKCSNCGVKIGFVNRPTFGQGKQKDGTEICLKCFSNKAKGIYQQPVENTVVDLELDTMQKLQFKKFISEQSGMNLQDVDNYLETLSGTEKEELIRSFKKKNTTVTAQSTGNNDGLICPKCRSNQVYADKKGFSGKKACCGAILAGPFGLLCGTHKSNKVRLTCLNCKHSW
ncbi:hypothetical protein ACHRV5_06650 [Flavobacterium sp. FlaQc-52]|jgi:hypothetical protein|uniref:hypothetical protein n=1 Tax=Flavobacterium sp. FlaQc-52 TaxID=3374185 RepID=UPI0037584434